MRISQTSVVTLGGVVVCASLALLYGYKSIVSVGHMGDEITDGGFVFPPVAWGGVDLTAIAGWVQLTADPSAKLLSSLPQPCLTVHVCVASLWNHMRDVHVLCPRACPWEPDTSPQSPRRLQRPVTPTMTPSRAAPSTRYPPTRRPAHRRARRQPTNSISIMHACAI
jgi:hypothetical protein